MGKVWRAGQCFPLSGMEKLIAQNETKKSPGFGVKLSKLSALGVPQAKEAAKDERLNGADIFPSFMAQSM